MRRKERYIWNSALLFGSIGAGRNLFNQYGILRERGQQLNCNTVDYPSVLDSGLKWAAGGALGGLAYYDIRNRNESNSTFNSDTFLHAILSGERLKSDRASFNRFLKLRTEVKDDLSLELGEYLAFPPCDAGSFAKRTAISGHDMDILLIFRNDSFYSLGDMYDTVSKTIYDLYGNSATIKGRESGFTVSFTRAGQDFSFDIIPGRLVGHSQSELSFYKCSDSFLGRSGYVRANFRRQRRLTMYKPQERQVIKLLKLYKELNGLNILGVAIEQMTVQAMCVENYGVESSITENFLNVMDYIADRILKGKLHELTNTNNNLFEEITWWEKQSISSLLRNDIQKVETNARYLREIFNQ
jgi:hypothetical protein